MKKEKQPVKQNTPETLFEKLQAVKARIQQEYDELQKQYYADLETVSELKGYPCKLSKSDDLKLMAFEDRVSKKKRDFHDQFKPEKAKGYKTKSELAKWILRVFAYYEWLSEDMNIPVDIKKDIDLKKQIAANIIDVNFPASTDTEYLTSLWRKCLEKTEEIEAEAGESETEPQDLITLSVAVRNYVVSKSTLRRAIKDKRIRGYKQSDKNNSQVKVSICEIEKHWPKK